MRMYNGTFETSEDMCNDDRGEVEMSGHSCTASEGMFEMSGHCVTDSAIDRNETREGEV